MGYKGKLLHFIGTNNLILFSSIATCTSGWASVNDILGQLLGAQDFWRYCPVYSTTGGCPMSVMTPLNSERKIGSFFGAE